MSQKSKSKTKELREKFLTLSNINDEGVGRKVLIEELYDNEHPNGSAVFRSNAGEFKDFVLPKKISP